MRISDWSSDVCSSDLRVLVVMRQRRLERTIIGRSLVLLLRALEGLEFDFGKGCADRTDLLDLSNLDKSQCGVTDCIFSGWRVSAEGERRARRSCGTHRSEEHTSELQSIMRISYAVFCLKKNKHNKKSTTHSLTTTK